MTPATRVVVVGGGIAGFAVATALGDAGVRTTVLDRGRRLGGRLAVRTRDGRPVDVGASYVVARDPAFVALVADWHRRGLARPWTDTFHVAGPDGIDGSSTGPMRWAAPGGLRTWVEDLAEALPPCVEVRHPATVAVGPGPRCHVTASAHFPPPAAQPPAPFAPPALEPAQAVALAMPDPQAVSALADVPALAGLRGTAAAVPWEPVLALVARYDRRRWPAVDGVFVNEVREVSFVADDGVRRGDGAPVLVAHSTPEYAAEHLADPSTGAAGMLVALTAVLGVDAEPLDVDMMRWTYARPVVARPEPYAWDPQAAIGLAGDGWHDGPRTECAWLSGRALGRHLVDSLG